MRVLIKFVLSRLKKYLVYYGVAMDPHYKFVQTDKYRNFVEAST